MTHDFDEQTRVTQVTNANPPEKKLSGNDCLVVIYSKESALLGKRFILEDGTVSVGRGADNEIVLDGDSVSRRHAHFEQRGNHWYAVDDNSTNGTYVNEVQSMTARLLVNNDRIKVGPTIFKFLSGDDVESSYYEEIYRMTIIDGLTQVHNKRYLSEALERELNRSRRHERSLSAVIFDLDRFKRINDQYGHLAGDHVLREVAKVVQTRIRREEVFARYGGEEFVILLPETPLEGAKLFAEDVRALVAENTFEFQGERIPVTVSIGCAEASAEDTSSELIQRADKKLYEAKHSGRNRVCA